MSEANKALFRRFIDEVLNAKNPEMIDELIGDPFTDHNPPPDTAPGREGMKQMMSMFFSAFPDLHVSIDQLIAEGDFVAGRMTNSGTHQGEFMGIAPTGKRILFSEIHIVRIANGKAVEHWGNQDDLAMRQQLGVIPSP